MPVPRRLFEAWERHVPSEMQMEGSVTLREEGGWEFEDARERPSRARAPPARVKRSCAGTWRPHQRHRAEGGEDANASAEHRGDSTAPRRAVRRDREEDDLERGIPASGAGGSAAPRHSAIRSMHCEGRAGGDCRSDRFRLRLARCTCHAGPG